jgi:flagellar assembly factor FliW
VQINSERFGVLDYDENEVVRFPEGLVGFPDMRRFFLYSDARVAPLAWLHSLDDMGLAFLVADPFQFFSDYEVRVKLPSSLRQQMGEQADLRVMGIVTVHADFAQSTINLLGPLVINARSHNGWQVILEDEGLGTRHRLFPDAAQGTQAKAS